MSSPHRGFLLLGTCLLMSASPPGCKDEKEEQTPAPTSEALAMQVSAQRLRTTIDTIAADETGGRIPGSEGHVAVRDYLVGQMEAMGLEPLGTDGYLQPYSSSSHSSRLQWDDNGAIVPHDNDTGYNVVGLLRGTGASDEYVVLMAHYDHLGVNQEGEIFNGAFDDGGGVAAVMEVARVLAENDAAPSRSLVFLLTDDEENGLRGAGAWVANPTVPLPQVVAGISADPLGRAHLPDHNWILIAGLERSPELSALWRGGDDGFSVYDRAFLNRDAIPDLFASDQDRFYEADVPAVWFVNPGFSFYHRVSDDPETIDYRVLRDSTRYLLRMLLLIGNDTTRYSYVGPQEISIDNAVETERILQGILASSSVLTESDRRELEAILADAQEVIAAGSWAPVGSPESFYFGAAFFIVLQLTESHPGEVPPPFPED